MASGQRVYTVLHGVVVGVMGSLPCDERIETEPGRFGDEAGGPTGDQPNPIDVIRPAGNKPHRTTHHLSDMIYERVSLVVDFT